MRSRSNFFDKEEIFSSLSFTPAKLDWAEELNRLGLQDYKNSAPSLTASVKEKETRLNVISQKLERLLTGYLDQVIDQVDYTSQKAKLLLEKKSLQEEMTSLSHKQNDWLAPFQNWLKDAQSLDKLLLIQTFLLKRSVPKKSLARTCFLAKKQCAQARQKF